MGTIRKIGDDYYIEFDARGLTYQRNGGKDKKAATQLLKEIEDKIQKGETSIVVHDVVANDFFKDFLKLISNSNDPRTAARYESVVGHFQEFVQTELSSTCKLSQITPSVIEKYRVHLLKSNDTSGRALKPKVINFTLYLLKDVLDYAINFGHINDNPTLHTLLIEVKRVSLPQTLNTDDVKNLSDNGKDHIQLLLKTGMSMEELFGLKWINIDFTNRCLIIESLPEALRRERTIPMDNDVVKIFKNLDDRKEGHQEYVFGKENGATIDIHTQWVLRNTFARDVLEKGVSLIGLSKLLGFKDIVRVMRYAGFVS